MKKVKKETEGRIKIIFLLFIMFFLHSRKIFAASDADHLEPSFYQSYMETLKDESDPYEYVYVYDQKERLYDAMKEEEWGSYLNILKYLILEHLANMPEDFRTEGEIQEAITLYRGTRAYLLASNKKTIEQKVTDFSSYEADLQTRLSVDVKICLTLFDNIDSSENEEMLEQASEELENYLNQIAMPNESASKQQIEQLFQLESIPLDIILQENEETNVFRERMLSGLQASANQVFAYGMRGDIATISVTEYYKGGGWKIHDQWSEGYLVTGKEGVVLGNEEPIFCADPNKMFRKGYYNKKPYPFPETITKIIVASLHRQKQVEEYSWLTKDYQYIAQQCIIWNVENEYKKWIVPERKDSRLRLEFGNSVHFPSPHQNIYISEKVFKLVDECIAWGKNNYKYFLNASADYYVKEEANQPIVRFYGTYTPSGFAVVKKSSSNSNITNGNGCYHLEDTEYGIFEDKKCINRVGTLRTDATGASNKVELLPGQYWIKETKPPKGYQLDPQIYSITVVSNQTQEVKLSDPPLMCSCDIFIEKIDQDTNQKHPQGNASLENAQFEVKFYGGLWEKGKDPQALGKTPMRTWIFQTNKEGSIRYDDGAKVSGDPLYTDPDGKPMLPLGTLTIQEKKAPEGYQINPTIYTVQLRKEEGTNTPLICQKTVVPETLLRLDIQKVLKGTKQPIENVMFTHIRPNGSKETIATDAKGEASFLGLEHGKHKIIETKVPDGYVLLPEEIILVVDEKNHITLENDSTSKPIENISFSMQKTGNGLLVVENEYVEYSLQIQKENETQQILEGAQFTLYEDEQCTQILERKETNQDGIALFEGLNLERCYYLKETAAPKGYPLPFNKDGSEIVYKMKAVYNSDHKELEYYINDKRQNPDQISGELKHPILSFKIINYKGQKLPETGNRNRMAIFIVCILCLTYWLFQKRRLK